MNLSINELFACASDKCRHLNVDLLSEDCELCQLLESGEIYYPATLAELVPTADVSMRFAIGHQKWYATFLVDFTIDSKRRILEYLLSLQKAENARVSEISFIEEKGKKVWESIKEVIEGNH